MWHQRIPKGDHLLLLDNDKCQTVHWTYLLYAHVEKRELLPL